MPKNYNYDETLQAIEEFKIKASTMEEDTALKEEWGNLSEEEKDEFRKWLEWNNMSEEKKEKFREWTNKSDKEQYCKWGGNWQKGLRQLS